MKTISIALLVALCYGPYTLKAQDQKVSLTLKEALEKGIQANKNIKINTEKVNEATAKWQDLKNQKLPSLSASGQYMVLNKPNVNLLIPGMSQMGSKMVSPNQMMFASLSTSIPIFAGFKLSYGIKAQAYLKLATELNGKELETQVAENLINAYYNLLKAHETLKVLYKNEAQSQLRVKDAQNLEKNGLMARNDLMKVQLQQSNVALAILEAENNVQIANYSMDLMLGMEEHTQLALDSTLQNVVLDQSLETYQSLAIQHRYDLKMLDAQKESAQLGVKAVKANYFPNIGLNASYMNLNVPNLLRVTNALSGGLGISYDIASLYKNKAKVQEAKSKELALVWQKEALNDQIKTEVFKAYQNCKIADQKINVYQLANEQAAENYRITKNKFDNSLATTTELLDADIANLQAQLNIVFAKSDAMTAYYHLQIVCGLATKEFNNQS